nr:helix-turn-helix domain-containing protein [Halobacterium sp. R2-5]
MNDLPPSAKLVFKVLEYDSPLTQAELRDRTRLSKRTTRHGLALLKDANLVEERVYIPDARKRIYEPRVID